MIRRFNYTGRRRIRREDARVSMRSDDSGLPIFSANLSLDRYKLPGDARIFVEAYRLTSFMRFPWGTVKQPTPAEDRTLTEFGAGDGVLFRVKVVEPTDEVNRRPARVLALADQLRPQRLEETLRQSFSLLEVVPCELNEVWRIHFPEDGGEPVLLVNQCLVERHHELVRSEQFVSLVLPQIVRTILTQIMVVEGVDPTEDGDDWRSLWHRFARTLPGVGDSPRPANGEGSKPENADELEEWIDTAVAAFARKCRIDQRFHDWWSDGGMT